MNIDLKRIYEPPDERDGRRVLVDRLWPRGITKEKASLDEWLKELAPSTELRKTFNHQPEKFQVFKEAYEKELDTQPEKREAISQLIAYSKQSKVTFVYAAKDPIYNHAVVLKAYLEKTGHN